MHILFLSPELFSIGGIQRYNRATVVALDRYAAEIGGKLSVMCLNSHPPERLPPELDGLQVTSFSCFSGRRSSFVLDFCTRLHGADVVIYGLLGFTPLALLQGLFNPRAASLLQLYGIDAWDYRSRLHAWGIRRAQSFASISQYTLDRFCRSYGISNGALTFVIPNSVPREFLRAAERALPEVGDGAPRLLTVTRLVEIDRYKGVDLVLWALPYLLRQFPDLVYVIIGDGSDRPRLEALASELGVREAVQFLGFVPEETLVKEFTCCSLYVMPSEREGFGFVFIEAMACGKPVVAARAGATPEVVTHGETGLLVEYGDISMLTEAISELLSDDHLRRGMGQAGREVVHSRYAFDTFCDRWARALDALGDMA